MAAQDLRNRIVQFTSQPVPHESPDLGSVFIRRLTLGELDRMQKENAEPVKPGTPQIPTTVRLLARFLGDEKGAPVFDLNVPADLETLMAFPVSMAADILRTGNRINKMEEEPAGKN